MCYAIPGKVTAIKDKKVTVNYFGEEKKAINEIDELKIGDYIYAQGGYVIKIIEPQEAQSILAVFKETFFELQEVDLRLSRVDLKEKGIDKKLTIILDKALEDHPLKDEELLYLLKLEKQSELELLFKTANFIRQKYLKNSCCVHGIIEFSNYCKRACHYCGISVHNKTLNRYRMSKDEIYEAAREAIEVYGFQALVLQSGEDDFYSTDDLVEIISEIKRRYPVLIFISVGEVGYEGLERLFKAGARGLLMRFETSNPNLYEKLHPGQKLETRISDLKAAFEMGYLIVTGSLIGIPEQTEEDLLSDILLTRVLKAEMYSFGPSLPHPKTPLKDIKLPQTDKILKVLAVSRLADPKNAKILVTTGFETLDHKAREKGLMAGANSVMLNVTPDRFKKEYEIYPKRAHNDESIKEQIETTLYLLRSIGRAPTDLGVS